MRNLLLLPGLMCDAAVWEEQRKELSDVADICIADYGDADSLEAMGRRALTAAPERFAVAGHSMGGRVALEVVRLAGGRTEKLALLDTGVHPKAEGEESQRGRLLELAREHGMRAVAETWAPPMVHPDRRTDAALMQAISDMIHRTGVDKFERQIKALLMRPDASCYLAEITCETLVLCGRQDSWAPVEQHVEIAGKLPNARLIVIENCGHMSPMEQPVEISRALREWLD